MDIVHLQICESRLESKIDATRPGLPLQRRQHFLAFDLVSNKDRRGNSDPAHQTSLKERT